MVLEADEAFCCDVGPVGIELGKFAAGHQFIPFGRPEMVFQYDLSVLVVPNRSFVDLDLY